MARRASSSPRVAARPSLSQTCGCAWRSRRALGDLAGSIVSMWIVKVLGVNPHQLGELRGLLGKFRRRELEYEFMHMNAS